MLIKQQAQKINGVETLFEPNVSSQLQPLGLKITADDFSTTSFSNTNVYYVNEVLNFSSAQELTIAENSVIYFTQNGAFGENVTVNLQNTEIIAPKTYIFKGTVLGTFNNSEIYPEWFGAVGDGVTDDASAIQKCIIAAGHSTVVGAANMYLIKSTIDALEDTKNTNAANGVYGYTYSYERLRSIKFLNDVIGDASLAAPIFRLGSEAFDFSIEGTLLVRNTSDSACGIALISSIEEKGSEGYTDPTGSYVFVNILVKGPTQTSYLNATKENATSWGYGKGTGIIVYANTKVRVNKLFGFNKGIHACYLDGGDIDVRMGMNVYEFYLGTVSGQKYSKAVTRSKFKIKTKCYLKDYTFITNVSDSACVYINRNVEIALDYFDINVSNSAWHPHNFTICTDDNKIETGFTGCVFNVDYTYAIKLNNGGTADSKFIHINCPNPNSDTANKTSNQNLINFNVGLDLCHLDVNNAFNTIFTNVIINNTAVRDYRYHGHSDQILLDKVIYTKTTAPEFHKAADTIRILVPNMQELNKLVVTETIPTSGDSHKLYIINNASTNITTGVTKYLVKGTMNGTFQDLGYYIDCYRLVNVVTAE